MDTFLSTSRERRMEISARQAVPRCCNRDRHFLGYQSTISRHLLTLHINACTLQPFRHAKHWHDPAGCRLQQGKACPCWGRGQNRVGRRSGVGAADTCEALGTGGRGWRGRLRDCGRAAAVAGACGQREETRGRHECRTRGLDRRARDAPAASRHGSQARFLRRQSDRVGCRGLTQHLRAATSCDLSRNRCCITLHR
jgi:hypothetical protein